MGASALNQRYLVGLINSRGRCYFRHRCERCGPLAGEHPEDDVIDSNLPTPPSLPGPTTAQSEEMKPDTGLPPTDVLSLRPGNTISPALIHHLCTRISRDAERDYSDRAGLIVPHSTIHPTSPPY